jgi:hypothetical protein
VSQYLSALAGYNGVGNHYAELGIAVDEYGGAGHHPSMTKAVYVSSEIGIAQDPVLAAKLGGWISTGGLSPLAAGLSGLIYTDLDKTQFRLRPEIGAGIGPFKIMYGFNPRIFGPVIPSINTHILNIVMTFPLKTIRRTIRD